MPDPHAGSRRGCFHELVSLPVGITQAILVAISEPELLLDEATATPAFDNLKRPGLCASFACLAATLRDVNFQAHRLPPGARAARACLSAAAISGVMDGSPTVSMKARRYSVNAFLSASFSAARVARCHPGFPLDGESLSNDQVALLAVFANAIGEQFFAFRATCGLCLRVRLRGAGRGVHGVVLGLRMPRIACAASAWMFS